jgi:hypothetical protein
MDELRDKIKNETIEKVKNHVSTYKPFESIIDIYVDMRLEQEELAKQILECEEYDKNYDVLSEILNDLKSDIKKYEQSLLIS